MKSKELGVKPKDQNYEIATLPSVARNDTLARHCEPWKGEAIPMCVAKDEIATLRSQQMIATLSSKARNDTLNPFVLSPFIAFIMKRDKPDKPDKPDKLRLFNSYLL